MIVSTDKTTGLDPNVIDPRTRTIEAMAIELDHYREALQVITHYEPGEGGDYFFENEDWHLPIKYRNMSAQDIAIKALEGAKK